VSFIVFTPTGGGICLIRGKWSFFACAQRMAATPINTVLAHKKLSLKNMVLIIQLYNLMIHEISYNENIFC
jgi:hypothetical protein